MGWNDPSDDDLSGSDENEQPQNKTGAPGEPNMIEMKAKRQKNNI